MDSDQAKEKYKISLKQKKYKNLTEKDKNFIKKYNKEYKTVNFLKTN